MKSSTIWSLIFLFFFTVGLYGFCLAQKPTDPNADDKKCSWTAGKTSVSDLSPEQKKKLRGLKLPEGYWEERDQRPKLEAPQGATFPTRFDWRDSNMVTPVKDQGQCGSCWDFAAVAALEATVKIYGEVEMDLSEQQVLSCMAYGWGCDGAWPELAFELFQSPGAAKEECMPYQANHWVACADETCEKWAKISGYTEVLWDVDAIKTALLTGPVQCLMAVPDTFFRLSWWMFRLRIL